MNTLNKYFKIYSKYIYINIINIYWAEMANNTFMSGTEFYNFSLI